MRRVYAFLFFLLLMLALPAQAHELRPAYLALTESADGQYEVLWKTPALGEKQLALKANFPETCKTSNGARTVENNNFAIETWTLTCPMSLRGQSLTIGGLEKTLTDVLVRTSWENGDMFTTRLTPAKTRLDFAEIQMRGGIIQTYFVLGVQHILGGIDHLLFVLAVMLLLTRRRKLFWAITAFTLGHSVTLVLASFDIVRVAPRMVETLIAMSIVLMAYEAARHWRARKSDSSLEYSSLTFQFPWLVTFSFGLLHGFGFAGALREIGLPQTDLPLALVFFNVGVEAGQLLFVSVVLILVSLPILKRPLKSRPAMIMASYCIGVLAVFWTLQRAALLYA